MNVTFLIINISTMYMKRIRSERFDTKQNQKKTQSIRMYMFKSAMIRSSLQELVDHKFVILANKR